MMLACCCFFRIQQIMFIDMHLKKVVNQAISISRPICNLNVIYNISFGCICNSLKLFTDTFNVNDVSMFYCFKS